MTESHGGVFQEAALVRGANCAADDMHPKVRCDGLELFFSSTRPGTLGLADLYSATRSSPSAAWSTPVNLGRDVNSALGAETRPSLSWDGLDAPRRRGDGRSLRDLERAVTGA